MIKSKLSGVNLVGQLLSERNQQIGSPQQVEVLPSERVTVRSTPPPSYLLSLVADQVLVCVTRIGLDIQGQAEPERSCLKCHGRHKSKSTYKLYYNKLIN